MKCLLLAVLLLPTLASGQTPVARQPDGSTWLIYAETISVGERLENGDRVVSAQVEKRDAQGRSLGRDRQFTTGCYIHGDGQTRWGYFSSGDEWTWSGSLILDIIATRTCQHAWNRVEPEEGVAIRDPEISNVRAPI